MSYAVFLNNPCGCWFIIPEAPYPSKQYLPQVDLNVHSTILSTTSRTTLTQTFINPSPKDLEEVKYTFPLYDGSSVVGFKCQIGDRVIKGVVKEREEARAEYQEAVSKGKKAGLLEQSLHASDTFTTSIGNIPANTKAVVEITYLGELQHDAQADGVRFTIPTVICPRYAAISEIPADLPESLANLVSKGAIRITVDVAVDRGSSIRGLQSPSHPIAISLGRTSIAADDVFEPHLASATLTWDKGGVHLDKDFVLIVNAKDQEVPSAFLENHPTIPNQRAVMATLVPKFNIPNISPEIVFIIDRSGSMYDKVETLQSALKVFLKSLPVGVKFNICSFGSTYSFMWKKSQSYDASNLKSALKYVDTVGADMGGTEMYQPVEATVKNRLKDLDMEILLLTDGEIWDQERLFNFINKATSENPIRFFSLGIGDSASHSLIQGIARAGGGFAQSVTSNEQLDKKVVRMLKGALTPHIKDYTVEIEYENDGEDDFEIVEKSNEIPMTTDSPPPYKADAGEKPKKKVISLFDTSYKEPDIKPSADPLASLPSMPPPKILQAPYKLTALYPFSRTSVYLLLSPETVQNTPKALLIKGTSKYGPLELAIPIEDIGKGLTIHQLAARKITAELEEGRGWVYDAKDKKGKLIMECHESKKDDIVKREAVRLGLEFQVAGKWCSFVAIEKDDITEDAKPDVEREGGEQKKEKDTKNAQSSIRDIYDPTTIEDEGSGPVFPGPGPLFGGKVGGRMVGGRVANRSWRGLVRKSMAPAPAAAAPTGMASPAVVTAGYSPSGLTTGYIHPPPAPKPSSGASLAGPPMALFAAAPMQYNMPSPGGAAGFGSQGDRSSGLPPPPPPPCEEQSKLGKCISDSPLPDLSPPVFESSLYYSSSVQLQDDEDADDSSFDCFGDVAEEISPAAGPMSSPIDAVTVRRVKLSGDEKCDMQELSAQVPAPKQKKKAGVTNPFSKFMKQEKSAVVADRRREAERAPASTPSQNKVYELIAIQSFDGSWAWRDSLFKLMDLRTDDVETKLSWSAIFGNAGGDSKDSQKKMVIATLVVVAYLHTKWLGEEETWELVCDKAMDWATKKIGEMGGDAGRSSKELLKLFDVIF